MSRSRRPLTLARFDAVAPDAGHYESWYLKARAPDPADARAFWLRHTVHQRPGEPRTASLWLTLFDGDEVRAGKQTWGTDAVRAPRDAYVEVGPARLEAVRASGELSSATLDAQWSLALHGDEAEQPHLPKAWMYDAPVPRTKAVSIHPAMRFSGTVADWDVEDWVGMVGHNWGSEHAERWVWLHAGQFTGRGIDSWIDATLGRVKVGGKISPWIGNAVLSLDGVRHRLGGIERVRHTRVDQGPTRTRFVLRGDDGLRCEGELTAPRERIATWRYADPAGPEHHSCHSSLADLVLSVRRPGEPDIVLHAPASATLEAGLHPGEHDLPVQPYADGVVDG